MPLECKYYVLVDKDDRPAIWESNPTFCTVESEVILELADKARPENAPHHWQELVPKQEPVGYAVLNSGKKLLNFSTVKSAAQIYKDVSSDYTLHEVMP